MTETYVGATDQGTTSTWFVLFDHDGRVVASADEPHEQISPEPGWVEHDPVEICEHTRAVVTDGLAAAGVDASRLADAAVRHRGDGVGRRPPHGVRRAGDAPRGPALRGRGDRRLERSLGWADEDGGEE